MWGNITSIIKFMSRYTEYLDEIEQRKSQELDPKPIDGAELLSEIILQIKDSNHLYRKESLDFFIYNVLPGTTSAAVVKSKFLKEIIIGKSIVDEINKLISIHKEKYYNPN